jgi:hypothetical protein
MAVNRTHVLGSAVRTPSPWVDMLAVSGRNVNVAVLSEGAL